MPLPRYQVHNYALDTSLVKDSANMIALVINEYVTTESMAEQVEALRVGDEQLSDKDGLYIRRIS
jgi:hypothetical protein